MKSLLSIDSSLLKSPSGSYNWLWILLAKYDSHCLLPAYIWTHACRTGACKDRQTDASSGPGTGLHLGCLFVLCASSWAASLELPEENCDARNLLLKHRSAAMPGLLRPIRVGMLEPGKRGLCPDPARTLPLRCVQQHGAWL